MNAIARACPIPPFPHLFPLDLLWNHAIGIVSLPSNQREFLGGHGMWYDRIISSLNELNGDGKSQVQMGKLNEVGDYTQIRDVQL